MADSKWFDSFNLKTKVVKAFTSRTLDSPTSDALARTSVKSQIGYQRWVGDTYTEGESENAENLEESEVLTIQDYSSDDAESGEFDEEDSKPDEDENMPPETGDSESRVMTPDGSDTRIRTPNAGNSSSSINLQQETPTSKVDTITEWQAGWNVTNAIQGMFIVSFPYTVQQGGYWSIIAMVVVAYICCYTGKILVACLYEEQKNGQLARVSTSYGDIAQRVFGKRFGRPIVNIAQVIELLMTCILYILLCGELLQGSFKEAPISLSGWIALSVIPLLLCAFIRTMRRVSWLSLWCTIAHMLINVIIIIYCFTLVKKWQPKAVTINPDIKTVPIAIGIIVFSYTSQIFLPTLEGKMIRRDKFHCMLHWTHIVAAIFKALFAYIGFVTFGAQTEELITNNLPNTLRIIVNIILVLKALLSYPLPYFAAVDIIESVFFQYEAKTTFPTCYKADMSLKWWSIILRLLLVISTMLMAIFIPHFAILMGLIGSFTGTMLSFVWPCIFHLHLKKESLKWYHKLLDVVIILLGILCGALGIYMSGQALFTAVTLNEKGHDGVLASLSEKAINETLQNSFLG